MAMRDKNHKLTLCEIIRVINDLCQDDSEKDIKIRNLLVLAEHKGKKMSAKLVEYKFSEPDDWFKDNPDAGLANMRGEQNYRVGDMDEALRYLNA